MHVFYIYKHVYYMHIHAYIYIYVCIYTYICICIKNQPATKSILKKKQKNILSTGKMVAPATWRYHL